MEVEAVWPKEFENFEQAFAKISWSIDDYNTERPHSSLNYRTPKEVRDEYFANNPTLTAT